jgi:excisionase family DNA binding protein
VCVGPRTSLLPGYLMSGTDEMEKFLTPKQLCELLQVDQSTVYLWTHTAFIPHYKLGRCVRFVEKDVLDWLQKRKANGRTAFKLNIVRL